MRKLVWSLLTTDDQLLDDGVNENTVISSQAVDTPKPRPFVLLVWGPTDAGPSQKAATTVRTLTVWVHDEPADYTRIDRIIGRIKVLMKDAVAQQEVEGGWLTQTDWTGDSGDLADDGYGTITRSTSFRVIGAHA